MRRRRLACSHRVGMMGDDWWAGLRWLRDRPVGCVSAPLGCNRTLAAVEVRWLPWSAGAGDQLRWDASFGRACLRMVALRSSAERRGCSRKGRQTFRDAAAAAPRAGPASAGDRGRACAGVVRACPWASAGWRVAGAWVARRGALRACDRTLARIFVTDPPLPSFVCAAALAKWSVIATSQKRSTGSKTPGKRFVKGSK